MKHISKLVLLAMLVISFVACDKTDVLPRYGNGTASVLSASSTTIAPTATDSDKVALTLNWSFPNYPTDSGNIIYVINIDSAGKNFANPATKTVTKSLSTTYTGKDLNNILLAKGYAFNVPVDMDVRLTSSYANNNERIASNVVRIKMTPYKVPPKIALPTTSRLFIVGDATDFGWTNDASPAFPAVRELTRVSETQWAGIFNMKGTGGYKLLFKQGDWSSQYHMIQGGDASAGTFEQKDSDPGFPSPATAGAYKVVFEFQTGRYTVTKVDNALATELYVTGDAVTPNWVNNPPAGLKFTAVTNGIYEITLPFVAGKQYKFLSSFGNWQPQFGGSSATGGTLSAAYSGDAPTIPTPAVAGNYKIQVNFITNTYTVTKV